MGDMNVKMTVSADGRDFERTLDRGEKKIRGFGKTIRGTMRRAGAEMGRFGSKIGGLTTVLGGLSVVALGKGIIDFDSRLARMAIQAGLTKQQMYQLKKELYAIGDATRQKPGALLAGMEQIVERTGNFDFAVKALKDMGTVSSATGADMSAVGATASDLNEKMDIAADRVLNMMDVLAAQGKKGSFTLQEMALLFPRLLAAAASFEVRGESGMRKFGAFLQIARRGTGTSEQAATAVERTISDIVAKAKEIRKLTGFTIFDPEKSKTQGRAVGKELDVVLKEIVRRTNGDVSKLQKIFNEQSIRAMLPLAHSFQKFGDFRELDAFVTMGGDGAAIMHDFSFWSDQAAANMTRMNTQAKKFVDETLATPIDALNSALDYLNEHPALTKGGLYGILGLLGIGAGAKVAGGIGGFARGIGRIFGKGGKTGKLGGLASGLLGGATPVPVYVVNQQMSLLPEAFGGGSKGGMGRSAGKSMMRGLGATLKGLLRRGPTGLLGAGRGLAALRTGVTVGSAGVVTTALAAAGSAAAGYGIGTLINKGLGAISGALSDGKYSGKGWLGEMIYDALHKDQTPELKNDIKINLRVDDQGRVTSDTDNTRTNASLALEYGEF